MMDNHGIQVFHFMEDVVAPDSIAMQAAHEFLQTPDAQRREEVCTDIYIYIPVCAFIFILADEC